MAHTANNATPDLQPLAVSVPAATRAAGIGRTRLYEAMRDGELASCKVGKRRLILLEDLRAWLARQRHAGTRPGPASPESRQPAGARRAHADRAEVV
jgi:excisionase family DNA binding protein